jgi:hypothetical protein
MSTLVSDEVKDAILAGETVITRRIEIYEADGSTRWWGDNGLSRVKGGQVGVDSTRDDRRNLDITLDNSDAGIKHDPVSGLWYDKIIKVFRGLKYQNIDKNPTVAILGLDGMSLSPITTLLQRIGFGNFFFFPSVATTSVDLLLNFDIIVAYNTVDFDAQTIALINSAYALGANIFTLNNHATSTSVQLIASTATRTGTSAWNIAIPATDNEFAQELVPYSNPGINNETIPLTIRATARPAAVTTYLAQTDYAAFYEQGVTGGRWFHYHPSINLSYTPALNVARELAFLRSAVSWLYQYGEQRSWETQIGEFMVDKIEENSFPHEIQITGRDYVKKLSRIKLDAAASWQTGFDIDTLVKSLAALAGLTKFRINSRGAKLVSTQSFDRTTDYWTIIKTCTDSVNVEVFFDAAGYLMVRPYLDPSTSPITFSLNVGGNNGNVSTFKRSSDDGSLYNRVVVTGISSDTTINDGIQFQAVAENHTPTSPTRIERIGVITYYYSSELFTSVRQCQDYANRLLKVMALENYTFDFESLVAPWVEAGEICEVPRGTVSTDPVDTPDTTMTSQPIVTNPPPSAGINFVNTVPDRYLLSSFTIPLGLNTMSGSAKRVNIVDATEFSSLQPFGGIGTIVGTS